MAGRRPRPDALVRVSTFCARPGALPDLLAAAAENARSARQATGCRSAEVCTAPDDPATVLVISRWDSAQALQVFLHWHEKQAHGVLAPHTAAPPSSIHYSVVSSTEPTRQ